VTEYFNVKHTPYIFHSTQSKDCIACVVGHSATDTRYYMLINNSKSNNKWSK